MRASFQVTGSIYIGELRQQPQYPLIPPPHHPPSPNTQPQHRRVRHKIKRHPAVEHRYFIDEPVIEPEKGQQCDGVNAEGRARPAAEPDEQPAQHRLGSEAANQQCAGCAQMLIGRRDRQPLDHMRRDQAPKPKYKIGQGNQALEDERSHCGVIARGSARFQSSPQWLHRLREVTRPDVGPWHDEIGDDDADAVVEQPFDIRRPFARHPCAARDQH